MALSIPYPAPAGTSAEPGPPTLGDLLAAPGPFSAVPPGSLGRIAAEARRIALPSGALLVTEGDHPDALYVILSGTLAVERRAPDGAVHAIAELGPGELVGELAFLDGAPRSASVRAQSDATLIEISAERLERAGAHEAVADLKASLGAAIAERMRRHNDRYVDALQREVESLRERREFGLFYIYTVATMGFGTLVDAVITRNVISVNVYSVAFSWQYLLALLVPMAFIVWRLRIPLAKLGLTRFNLGRSVLEGIAISAAVIGVMWGATLIAVHFFGFRTNPFSFDLAGIGVYTGHALLQELFARGFIQSSFQRFLDDRRGLVSVALASFMFGLFHLHYGLTSVAITGLGGLIFGLIYLRHRNLAGVTIVHVAAGIAAFSFGLL